MTIGADQPTSWLITIEQRDAARRLQKLGGGVIGPINVPAPDAPASSDRTSQIDVITHAIEKALDRASANRLTNFESRSVSYERLRRSHTRRVDLLDEGAGTKEVTTIDGAVVLEIDGQRSLPLEFTVDEQSGFAVLDDSAEQIARRWIDRLARSDGDRPAGAPESPDLPSGFEDSVIE